MKKLLFIIALAFFNSLSYSQCFQHVTIIANPWPVNGCYAPGTVVTFTATVQGYTQSGSSWFHGGTLLFNDNWDLNSIKGISPATSCDGAGQWGFYDSCGSYCSGMHFGKGFYYDRSLNGCSGCPGDGIPGNNLGDFSPSGNCAWTFVWSVAVDSNAVPGATLNDTIWFTSDNCPSCTNYKYPFSALVCNAINGIKFIDNSALLISVYPNPCHDCEIKGINNPADLVVTDLIGRTINVTYDKTANGYLLNFPKNTNGLFLIKNTQTGEVVKLVKE